MRPIETSRGFGLAIRKERKDQGLTQAQLAEKARVGRPWLSELETGKQTAEIGRAFAVLCALGLSVSLQPAPKPAPGSVDLDMIIDGQA